MHNKKYAQLLGDFSLGIMQRVYQDDLWNRNQKSGSESDDSDDSTSSVKRMMYPVFNFLSFAMKETQFFKMK